MKIDPFLLEAMHEVDALTPEAPRIAPPEPRLYEGIARTNPACSHYDNLTMMYVMKNGERVAVERVRLLGWDRALEEADFYGAAHARDRKP